MTLETRSATNTARRIVDASYVQKGRPFRVNTKPYESTQTIKWRVVAGATQAQGQGGLVTAWLVADEGQDLSFFSYGRGQPVPQPSTLTAAIAGFDDTNLSKGKETNEEDFVIEGMSVTCRSTRVQWSAGDIATMTGPADAAVLSSVNGGRGHIVDPLSLYAPLVTGSPALLENTLFSRLLPHIHMQLSWNETRVEILGTLENFPEGGAASYLRASGVPSTTNRANVPEGYVWRRVGASQDTQMIAQAKLVRAVSAPAIGVVFPGQAEPGVLPVAVYTDIKVRLHGIGYSYGSRN